MRPILGSRSNLFLLCFKNDEGLCTSLQLPQHADSRIIYYEEWVPEESKADLKAKSRKTAWHAELNNFCAEYRHTNLVQSGLVVNKAAPKTPAAATDWTQAKLSLHESTNGLCKAVIMYAAIGATHYLEQALSAANECLGIEPGPKTEEEQTLCTLAFTLLHDTSEFDFSAAQEMVPLVKVGIRHHSCSSRIMH